jgi:serine/threonine-protein kinase
MGSVYWAKHQVLGRDVAIKFSPPGQGPHQLSRFVREAHIVGKFHHRNIVNVLDAGTLPEQGRMFLVMELLHGEALSRRLVPGRPMAPEDALPILIEVCRGLEAAHEAGVVHRDIKPENVFLANVPGEGIVPKLLDFGISRTFDTLKDPITANGELLGTPAYMSPEQALGRAGVDYRADLWSVGVILYETLTGSQPFFAPNTHALLRRIIEEPPSPMPVWVDERLQAICLRCLQKKPEERYQDAAALRADLENVLASSLSTPPPSSSSGISIRARMPAAPPPEAINGQEAMRARLVFRLGAAVIAALLAGPLMSRAMPLAPAASMSATIRAIVQGAVSRMEHREGAEGISR